MDAETMRYRVRAEGFGLQMRPVRMDDAAFIVWLRNQNHVKGKVGDSVTDVAKQQAWLEAYFERKDDYYFIFETLGGVPVGTGGIYNFSGGDAEAGRWVIRRGVPGALPSAIIFLDMAFNHMRLDKIHGVIVAGNRTLFSMHRRFGFWQTGIQPAARIIAGKPVDMVHFMLKAAEWPAARERLLPLARRTEKRILQWEHAHTQGLQRHRIEPD